MRFSEELPVVIRSYLSGQLSQDDLRRWLDDHAQLALDSGDQDALRLFDQTWALHIELREGNVTEDELRVALKESFNLAGSARPR